MGSQESNLQLILTTNHSSIFKVLGQIDSYIRSRVLVLPTDDDYDVLRLQINHLSHQGKPYLVLPISVQKQSYNPCSSGIEVTVRESYYSHSFRQLLSNYKQQCYQFKQKEIMYLLQVILESQRILAKQGIMQRYTLDSIYVDVHGQIKIYPEFCKQKDVIFIHSNGSPSFHHSIAALILEILLFRPVCVQYKSLVYLTEQYLIPTFEITKIIRMLIREDSLSRIEEMVKEQPCVMEIIIIRQMGVYVKSIQAENQHPQPQPQPQPEPMPKTLANQYQLMDFSF